MDLQMTVVHADQQIAKLVYECSDEEYDTTAITGIEMIVHTNNDQPSPFPVVGEVVAVTLVQTGATIPVEKFVDDDDDGIVDRSVTTDPTA